jgi:two-component system sensor histidine kinase HydH
VRVAQIPPGPRARQGGPPGFEEPPGTLPPGPPGQGRRGEPHGEGPPALLIEFEPLEADAVRRDATLELGIALGAALALLAAAGIVGRLLGRAQRAQALQARQRRLAALGEMSAVLAHEIRNPLASLKGHAQLLAEQLDPGGRPHQKAERVVREATRLEKLTTDLLDFVRTERLQISETSPGQLLRAAVETVETVGAVGAAGAAGAVATPALTVDVAAAPPTWSLDARLVAQALGNLLRNAVQASPADAVVEAAVAVEGGALVFTVRDRGPGVPAAERERVFEPFHTQRVRGTGLGLAITRRIARLHGGDATVAAHPDGGAVFRLALPAAAPEEV